MNLSRPVGAEHRTAAVVGGTRKARTAAVRSNDGTGWRWRPRWPRPNNYWRRHRNYRHHKWWCGRRWRFGCHQNDLFVLVNVDVDRWRTWWWRTWSGGRLDNWFRNRDNHRRRHHHRHWWHDNWSWWRHRHRNWSWWRHWWRVVSAEVHVAVAVQVRVVLVLHAAVRVDDRHVHLVEKADQLGVQN